MKIIIGGGAGYVGTALVASLVERGYEVKVIDLLWFGNNIREEIEVIRKNLFSCDEKDLRGFDQFVFLAGLSNDPMAEFSPSLNFKYNAALPAYLAYMSKLAGIKRYIYASSCSVYGYTVDELYDEESPVNSSYPYGISKLQGEKGVLSLEGDGFSVIALRNGTVSGWSPRMRFDLIINTMVKTLIREGRIVINNPAIWRPILDIRDQVAAYLRAIQADLSISGVYNIASDNYTVGQVGDLVKLVVEKETNRQYRIEIRNIQDYRNYKVTINKAETKLGFKPNYGIEDTVLHVLEHLDDYGDMEDSKYYNIQTFKRIILETGDGIS